MKIFLHIKTFLAYKLKLVMLANDGMPLEELKVQLEQGPF
jgi:hypothetical protein